MNEKCLWYTECYWYLYEVRIFIYGCGRCAALIGQLKRRRETKEENKDNNVKQKHTEGTANSQHLGRADPICRRIARGGG